MDSRTPEGHSSRLKSCALFALVPVLLLVALVTIFIINNRPVSISVPTPKMPKDNGWVYFLRAAGMMRGIGPASSPRPESSWTIAELEHFTRENQPMLAEVRRGLTKPYLHPPVRDYDHLVLPGDIRCREVARKLSSMTQYYHAVGAYGKAADVHLDCMEMGATLPRGGALMAGLVGAAVEAIGAHGFPRVLPKLSRRELEHVAGRMEIIASKRVSCSEVLMQEADAVAASEATMLAGDARLGLGDIPAIIPTVTQLRGAAHEPWEAVSYAFSSKQAMVRENHKYLQDVAAEQRGPYTGKSGVAVPRNTLARSGLDPATLVGTRRAFVQAEARLALIQTEVALRRYRLDHGPYPVALASLVPAYLKSESIDPFGLGKPLNYKPVNGGRGFLLYSLGPNLKDDGGKPGSYQDDFATGDIVAGQFCDLGARQISRRG